MARPARNPAYGGPGMFDPSGGAPGLFGPALHAALGSHPHHHQSQPPHPSMARSTPPPRIPGNYPNPPFNPQHGHAARPSMAGFVPSSMPPGGGFAPMPGAIPHPHGLPQVNVSLPMGGPGMQMPMPMGMPMPMSNPGFPPSVSPAHSHGRSPSQLHIPQLTPHQLHQHSAHAPSPSALSPGGFNIPPHAASQLHGHARSPSQLAGLGPSPTNSFERRSRRQPSLGGPPKAALGGPQARKLTLSTTGIPGATVGSAVPSTPITATGADRPKKYVVLLPLEGESGGLEEIAEEDEEETGDGKAKGEGKSVGGRKRSLWVRVPVMIVPEELGSEMDGLLETLSRLDYEFEQDQGPPYMAHMPAPGAWDRYKQEMVDSKLASLGYGVSGAPGAGGPPTMQMPVPIPAIMAPAHAHSRSLSMTSSFSPGLLQFKLAKLSPSANSPLASPGSENPPPISTGLPGGITSMTAAAIGRRLGHQTSMSLSAAAPEFTPRFTFPVRGMNSVVEEQEPEEELAPAPAPLAAPSGVPAVVSPRPTADKPKTAADFARGFALDDPSEDGSEAGLLAPEAYAGDGEGDASGVSVYQDVRDPSLSISGSAFGTAPEPDLSRQASELDFESAGEGEAEEEEDHEREDLSEGDEDAEGEPDPDYMAEVEDDMMTLPSHSRRPTATGFPVPVDLTLQEELGLEEQEEGESTANASVTVSRKLEDLGEVGEGQVEQEDEAVADWTASEDPRTGEEDLEDVDEDDDDSDSMWSNPSDEERHRQERLHNRMLKAQGIEHRKAAQVPQTPSRPTSDPHTQVHSPEYNSPRRLPNFPNPPKAGLLDPESGVAYLPTQRSDRSYSMHTAQSQEDASEVLSNPSEEAGAVENFEPSHTHAHVPPPQAHASVYYSQPAPQHPHQGQAYPIPYAPIPYPSIHHAHTHTHSHSPHASITLSSHSRTASNTVFSPEGAMGPQSLGGTTLNPHAKPFVFGGAAPAHTRPSSFTGSNPLFPASPASATSPQQQNPYPTPPSMTMHGRQGSMHRLNAHAAEFTPTFSLPSVPTGQGFTFQPPPQAPSLSFDFQAESTRMVDSVDLEDDEGRLAQGREKRRRRTGESDEEETSQLSEVDNEDKENVAVEESDEGEKRQRLAGFQFPQPALPPPAVLQSSPFTRRMTLDPIQTDFTFESPGWSTRASAPAVMPMPIPMTMPVPVAADPEPAARMPQSTSIPMEFNRPTTKVPASLFKALNAYGSDGDSRGKRSRVASRDFRSEDELEDAMGDADARLLVSDLVDSTVADASSRRENSLGQSRTLEMAIQQVGPSSFVGGLVAPVHAVHRALSMPQMRTPSPSQSHDMPALSSNSDAGATAEQMEELEERIASLLEDKMGALAEVLTAALAEHAEAMRPITEAAPQLDTSLLVQKVAEAVEARVQDNLPLALSARGPSLDLRELQLDVVKRTIADQYEELRQNLVQDISEVCRQTLVDSVPQAQEPADIIAFIEDSATQTQDAISSAVTGFQEIADNINSLARQRSEDERELLLSELSSMVLPQIASLQTEPLDIDALTTHLSQAVKPHISQLIDLASDKKETAELIIQRLGPLLSSMMPAPLDVNAISEQMAGYVERLMPPPLNVKAMKQELASGVSEALKKQLAESAPKQSNEVLAQKITEMVSPLIVLADLVPIAGTFDNLTSKQEAIHTRFETVLKSTEDMHTRLAAVPKELSVAIEALSEVRQQLAEGGKALTEVKELQKLAAENAELRRQLAETSASSTVTQGEKTTLENAAAAAKSERDVTAAELRDLRAELESWKARTSDSKALQGDLEKQVGQKEAEAAAHKAETSQIRERLTQAEKDKTELLDNNLRLKSQVSKLEREASTASRDVEVLHEKVAHLEQTRDELRSQQMYWDDIRRTALQVEALTKLISNADDDELQELRRQRDRAKLMEGEFAAMKKRYDEQESKLANLQRNSIASKNSIAQVQQRSTEWEKKWRTAEAELTQLRSERETSEALRRQLDSDMSMMQERLEDVDTREAEYRAQQGSLEAEVQQLRQQLDFYTQQEQARQAEASRPPVNGNTYADAYGMRPSMSMDSEETAYSSSFLDMPDHAEPRTPKMASPSTQGIWASMHAPKLPSPERATTPKAINGPGPSYLRSMAESFKAQSIAGSRTASPAMSKRGLSPTFSRRALSPAMSRRALSPAMSRRALSPAARPVSKNFSPAVNNYSPAPNNYSPALHNFSPALNNYSPALRDFSPAVRNSSPAMSTLSTAPTEGDDGWWS